MNLNTDFLNNLVSGISTDRMMEHLQEFSRWKKLAGSTDEAQSLKYIRSVLDRYGLRTTLLFHDAFISLPEAAYLEFDGKRFKAITHSMALPTPEVGLTRKVIDLGSGSQADFNAVDVRDQIVLIDGMATPEMAKRCRHAGAVGQVHISPHEYLHEMCLSPIWGNPDFETIQNLPTSSVVTVSDEDGKAIRAHPDLVATIHAKVDTGWRKIPILIADLEAGDAPKDAPYILFSGHHDTWYEGVMDNGSANATMMEVTYCMAKHRNAMKRHLRLCFWSGHSQGRYSGSTWFVDQYWHELERDCAVHVNVDSTGGEGNTLLSTAPAATELSELAQDAIKQISGQNHDGIRMARNSDQSFWGIGIPSLFGILSCQPAETVGVRNALGWWWHTPHDKIERINPALLLRDTQIYAHALAHLVSDPYLPLDIAAQVADLLSNLAEIKLLSECGVPLTALRTEVKELHKEMVVFQEKRLESPEAYLRRDRTLMLVSRQLVPLDYTYGDQHSHDPALPLPKWPSLEALRNLAEETGGSDVFLLRRGLATRSVNRLLSNVRNARALLVGKRLYI
jgi:hypothetical protein